MTALAGCSSEGNGRTRCLGWLLLVGWQFCREYRTEVLLAGAIIPANPPEISIAIMVIFTGDMPAYLAADSEWP